MGQWFTCREPLGRAIGKIHLDMEIDNVIDNPPSTMAG